MSVLKIEDVPAHAAGARPADCHRTYRCHTDDHPVYLAHIPRNCMKPATFVALEAARTGDFVLEPTRRWIPMTWQVIDTSSGHRIGSLKRQVFGKIDWHVRDARDRPCGQFVGHYNPRHWLLRLGDVLFSSTRPDGYRIVINGTVAARMEQERRPAAADAPPKTGLRKWLGKILVDMDWVIRKIEGHDNTIDPRLLFAGVVLLELISRDTSAPD